MSTAAAAAAAYESAVGQPSIASAMITASTATSAHVTMTASQPVIAAGETRTWTTDILVTDESTKPVGFPTAIDPTAVRTASPSGKSSVVFKTAPGIDGKPPKTTIQLWSADRFVAELDASGVHGAVYTSSKHTFGGLSWSPDESKIIYPAEPKLPNHGNWWSVAKSDTVSGEKFGWSESWGEQHETVISPQLYTLDVGTVMHAAAAGVNTGTPVRAVMHPDFAGTDRSLGQPKWCPDGEHFVFVAWPHHDRKLGIVYCTNRPSHLYVCKLGQDTPPAKLSGDDAFSARSPMFSPDGSKLLWIGTAIGGPHCSNSIIKSAAWSTGAQSLTDVAETVGVSTNPDAPGLAILAFPDRPWISNTKFICSSPKNSASALVSVDVEANTLEYLEEPTPGNWGFLDATVSTDGVPSRILASCSTPNTPPMLYIGNVAEGGWFDSGGVKWQQLFSTTTTMPDEIGWEVITFNTTPVKYEAILLTPKNAKKAAADDSAATAGTRGATGESAESSAKSSAAPGPAKTPLIVMPHGGPHSVTTIAYTAYNAAFVQLGYSVLCVNYRGSLGFSDAGITSLPGKVGVQDVQDVNDAVTAVIATHGVDPERVAVFGGSHGGFLTAHLSAQFPDRYKSAVMRNPVIDIAAMVPATDIPDWCYHEAGLPYGLEDRKAGAMASEVYDKMHKASPIAIVEAVKAPTMVLIGLKDKRVPTNQGWLWHNALRAAGKESRVYTYPDDHHALDGVECAGDVFVNTACWYSHHLSGSTGPFRA